MSKYDHIDQIIHRSLEFMELTVGGKLGIDKSKTAAKHASNALRGIGITVAAQNNKYGNHDVSWVRQIDQTEDQPKET